MTGDYSRTERVADYLKREIATIIQQEMRDPRVAMASVTGAEVSRDLAHAKVFVTFMQADDERAASEGVAVLNKAAGFIRSRLAADMSMRTTPKLHFFYDESVGRGRYMEDLIQRAVSTNAADSSDEGAQ